MADQNNIDQKELDDLLSGISDNPTVNRQVSPEDLNLGLKEQSGLGLDEDSINALVGNLDKTNSTSAKSDDFNFGELGSLSTQPSHTKVDNLELLKDVTLRFTVELGRTEMLIKDVLHLDDGSIVELDRDEGDEVDIYINDCVFAKGKLYVVDEEFYGVQILTILNPNPLSNAKLN